MPDTPEVKRTEEEERFFQVAREEYHRDGEIEFDDDAKVSIGDPCEGAYVQAWVWIANPDECEEEDDGAEIISCPQCGLEDTRDYFAEVNDNPAWAFNCSRCNLYWNPREEEGTNGDSNSTG
jgi:uncharacterized C2H2 Zn-finger protein